MDSIVKREFEAFLSSRLPQQTLDVLDDIVIDYLTGVLKGLAEDDSTNIDDFIEMMNAYMPGFSDLQSDMVFSWLIDLASKMQQDKPQEYNKIQSSNEESPNQQPLNDNIQNERKSCTDGESTTYECVNSACSDETKPDDDTIPQGFCVAVESLCELFPMATKLEVRRCLMVANGNADEAARLMLLSRENDVDVLPDSNPNIKPHTPSIKKQDIEGEDLSKMKNDLVSRYGFEEVKSDGHSYKPSLVMKEEKKMIRYRDNNVVSTKGERFSMVKKQENEDEKKTYINLKPARKYRFH